MPTGFQGLSWDAPFYLKPRPAEAGPGKGEGSEDRIAQRRNGFEDILSEENKKPPECSSTQTADDTTNRNHDKAKGGSLTV